MIFLDLNETDVLERRATVQRELKVYSDQHSYETSAAFGYEFHDEVAAKTIPCIFSAADKRCTRTNAATI
ncbi:MAG: hypothetical protein RSF90_03665 [Pygmaiobacter sp.]